MPSQWKKEKVKTWRLCSEYIRKRDCLKTTGTLEHGQCCTCGKIFPYGKLDAGHYHEGHRMSVYFNLINIHAQCIHCNRFMEGMRIAYAKFMKRTYSEDELDKLAELNNQLGMQYKIHHFKDMQSNFKRMIKELEDEKP